MQVETFGQLDRPGRPLEFAQQREQPGAGRLGQRIVGFGYGREIHLAIQFYTYSVEKRNDSC